MTVRWASVGLMAVLGCVPRLVSADTGGGDEETGQGTEGGGSSDSGDTTGSPETPVEPFHESTFGLPLYEGPEGLEANGPPVTVEVDLDDDGYCSVAPAPKAWGALVLLLVIAARRRRQRAATI